MLARNLLLASASLALACGGDTFSSQGDGGTDGTGGRASGGRASGGATSTGGASTAGGRSGAGGGASTGGAIGAGGRTGSGGVGGGPSTGGATGAGGSGAECPPVLPDGACSTEGLECSYGECCPAFARCLEGQWQVAIAPCLPPRCPDAPPSAGDPCPCEEGLACEYGVCSPEGQRGLTTCTAGSWRVAPAPCTDHCANVLCPAGTLCVATRSPDGATEDCVACPNEPADPCQCAQATCELQQRACVAYPSGSGVECR